MAKPTKHGKSWRIRWSDENGNRHSECYPTYRDAEYVLKKKETEVEEIRKGLRVPTPPNKTFIDLCEAYKVYRSSRKRNPGDDESIVRVHLKPFFKDLPLIKISSQINEFVLSKHNMNPKTLHNVLTLLISMLRFAHEEKWIFTVPKIKKPRIIQFDKDFHYLRTPSEITYFLKAAKEEGDLPCLAFFSSDFLPSIF